MVATAERRWGRLCLKCCARCGGDIFEERDLGSDYCLVCLQCGHILSLAEEAQLRAALVRPPRVA